VADLAAGQQALKSGDYATALKELLPLANANDAIAQFSVGVMYDAGLCGGRALVPQSGGSGLRFG
jgi:hypothetical protein